MTQAQIDRLYRNAWRRMKYGSGYQPWGYDWVTMRLTSPGWYRTLRTIRAMRPTTAETDIGRL